MADPTSSGSVVRLPRQRRTPKQQRTSEAELPGVIYISGKLKPCEHNALTLIGLEDGYRELHFDTFLHRMRFGDRDWNDHDDRSTVCWLQRAYNVPSFTLGQIRNGVRALAYQRRRDSLQEFLLSLPEWDGTSRISLAFTDAWGAPRDPLTLAASRNFFIALAARAMLPGAQVDTLWSFEGPQGSNKSRSLRALGGQFHAEMTAPIGSPDFFRELRGIWIAEISELDSLRGREASTIKRVLSAPVDRFVEKYESHAASYPRRAVAVATTNESQYWQDATGARRLIPIRTGTIRVDLIEQQREQWFAEALFAYRSGLHWWDFPEGMTAAQDERQHVDPWEDALRQMISKGRVDSGALGSTYHVAWPDGWIASAEIMRDWLKLEPHQQGQNSSTRLGKVMTRLGYVPHRYGKERDRGWIKADTEPSSIEVSAEVSA